MIILINTLLPKLMYEKIDYSMRLFFKKISIVLVYRHFYQAYNVHCDVRSKAATVHDARTRYNLLPIR